MRKITLIPLFIMTMMSANAQVSSWKNIAYEYMTFGQHQKAIPFLQQALSLEPNDVIIKSELAYSYQVSGNNDLALQEYLSALDMISKNTAKGLTTKTTASGGAETNAQTAENVSTEIKYNIGLIYAAQGNLDAALLIYNEIATQQTTYSDAYLNRAIISTIQQKYRDAEKDYITFLELAPEDAQRETIERILALLAQMRDFPSDGIDKAQFKEKQALENELNKNKARLYGNPNNKILGQGQ